MLPGMAVTVTVEDEFGATFRCTETQWLRLHKPAGRRLANDEQPKVTPEPEADPADEGD